MKRFGHKKSRTGCTRCKQRRVKCDERSPCSACNKHGVSCSLAPGVMIAGVPTPSPQASPDEAWVGNRLSRSVLRDSPTSSLSPDTSASEEPGQPGPSNATFSNTETVPYFSKFLDNVQRENIESWTADLELMHHYTAIAHSTFTSSAEVHRTLQHDVTRVGLQHDFLLQQILAFSGFHLSYLQPKSRRLYVLRASRHQHNAIEGLRATLAGQVTSKNCHALYASSIFLIICAFATFPSYETYNSSFSPIDSIVDILRLADGISVILGGSSKEIRDGPLKGLFTGKKASPTPLSDRVQQLIERLTDLESQAQTCSVDCQTGEMELFIHLLRSMVDALLNVHQTASLVVSPELRSIFLWPMLLSNRHLDFVRSRRPMALVILSYYCVILRYAAECCWFLEGWAEALSDNVERSLVGSGYEQQVRWPISVIRLA